MAFDAGMLACVISEIRKNALGARIEKVFQPERDEIVLQMRSLPASAWRLRVWVWQLKIKRKKGAPKCRKCI